MASRLYQYSTSHKFQYSTIKIQHSTIKIQHSTIKIQRSTTKIQRDSIKILSDLLNRKLRRFVVFQEGQFIDEYNNSI